MNFKIGDKVIFFDASFPDNPEDGDIGVIVEIKNGEVRALWEKTGRTQYCRVEDIQHDTKLARAMK